MLRLRRGRPDESGAVAVLVAITMTVLLFFAAFALDMGQIWAARTAAQNAADAAAMAVAQKCSKPEGCDDPGTVADFYARANNATSGIITDSSEQSATVQVEVGTNLLFAPLMGMSEQKVLAQTSAQWSGVEQANTVPLLISMCDYRNQVGGLSGYPDPEALDTVLWLQDTSDTCDLGASAANLPSGFFHVMPDTDSDNCTVAVTGEANLTSESPTTSACSLSSIAGRTIVVGIFDRHNAAANSFHIAGFAAFKVAGFCTAMGSTAVLEEDNPYQTCSPETQHLYGHFVPYATTQVLQASDTAPDLGVTAITLN